MHLDAAAFRYEAFRPTRPLVDKGVIPISGHRDSFEAIDQDLRYHEDLAGVVAA